MTSQMRVSQLCKPLWNCLHEQTPLSILEYLIQFMAARDALHLLQFWFSVTSFKNAIPSSAMAPSHSNMPETVSELLVQGSKSRCGTIDTRTLQSQQASVKDNNVLTVTGSGAISLQPTTLPTALDSSSRITSVSTSYHRSTTDASQSVPVSVEVKQSGGCGDSTCGNMNGVSGGKEIEGEDCVVVGRGNQVSMCGQRKGRTPEITRQTSLNVVTDAMGIYSTYIALNALTPVHIPDDIRQRVEVNICPEDEIVDRTCFDEAQQFVYDLLENQYYPEFLRSSFLCKYQLELVSSGKLGLLDFLLGGAPLIYLMEFMEQENAMALLQFWLTAESFHIHVASLDKQCSAEATMQDAIAIYDRYFSLQATEPLGMEDKVRVEIELGICDEQGPQADSFVAAQHIAYNKMIKEYYPNFLESGFYLRFLDDLLRMVKLTPDQQTLAESNSLHTTTSCQTEVKTVDYFTCDVDDPESLWKQPQLLMRLGYMDTMGQYCSEIDPFPTKTLKSREQPQPFRWFKNRQEEEEWQLAVTISRNIVAKVLKRNIKHHLENDSDRC